MFNRALLYSRIGKFEKAVKDLSKAIIFEPDDIDLYHNRALIYRRLGKFAEAQTDYNQIKAIKKKNGMGNIDVFLFIYISMNRIIV